MPEIGRFISEDPWPGTIAEPVTMNPYPYVKNNPLKFVDPLGLASQYHDGDGYIPDPDDGDDSGSTGGNNGGNSGGTGGSSGGNTGGGDTGGGDTGGNDDVVEEVSLGIISKGIGGAIDGICNFIGKRSAIDNVQLGLDVLGMAPGIGEVFDVINAGIYFARGDVSNGFLSLASAIPLLGNLTSGSKLALKVGAAAGGTAALSKLGKTAIKNVDKVDELADAGKRMGNMNLQMFAKKTRKTDFIVTESGTAVHASQAKMIDSIKEAGAVKVGSTNKTSEIGEIFNLNTPNGPMEIRVMQGRPNGGPYQGPRTINTRRGAGKTYVYPDGSEIKRLTKNERKRIGHIHGQRP